MPPGVRRRRPVAGTWVVGTLAVVATGWWTYDRMADTAAGLCDALAADVVDAPSIVHLESGATGPHWSAVLTLGVDDITPSAQRDLAAAVTADDEGYAALRDVLPSSSRPVADRQRARVLDPGPAAERRADPAVRADSRHLSRLAGERCGLV